VIPPDAAGPEVEDVAAVVSGVAAPSAVVAAVVSGVAAPPAVVAAPASVADAAAPRASSDIAPAFDALVALSVVEVEVDTSGRPRFFAFPNVGHYASSSSSVEVPGTESVHSSTGVRANHGLCNIVSTPDLHHNRNSEHSYNTPSPGHNNVSDTTDLPMGATTSRSRKTGLYLYREQHTRRSYQARRSHPEAPRMRWAAAGRCLYLYLPLPLPEQERQRSTPKRLSPKVTFSFFCLLLIKNIDFTEKVKLIIAELITH
jgi:hypothetical protein